MLYQHTVMVPPLVEHPEEVPVEPQTWPLLSRAWQTESGDYFTRKRSVQILNPGVRSEGHGAFKRTQPVLRDSQAAWARPMAKADMRRLVTENFMFAKIYFCPVVIY